MKNLTLQTLEEVLKKMPAGEKKVSRAGIIPFASKKASYYKLGAYNRFNFSCLPCS